jgi:hypothetical protein
MWDFHAIHKHFAVTKLLSNLVKRENVEQKMSESKYNTHWHKDNVCRE